MNHLEKDCFYREVNRLSGSYRIDRMAYSDVFVRDALYESIDPESGLCALADSFKMGRCIPGLENDLIDGFSIDYSKIGAVQRRHLKWKIAAQNEWIKSPTLTVDQMKDLLLRNPDLCDFLETGKLPSLDNLNSRFRGFEDVIRKARPPGRRSEKRNAAAPISDVLCLSRRKVRVQALYVIIDSIYRLMWLKTPDLDETSYCEFLSVVSSHPITRTYTKIGPIFSDCIDRWIVD